jgi:SulP family sulfate permease
MPMASEPCFTSENAATMNTGHRRQKIRSVLPLLATLQHYQASWLGADLVAGLTACIVMIPSVIAYAELVHLPPITGLYASLAAAVGYALFASSKNVIAGPDAAIGLLVGSAILPIAAADPARLPLLAAELGLLTGALLWLAARLKLGVIADLLSRPVLVGYLNGASLILISTQLGKMVAIPTRGEAFFPLLGSLISQLPLTHWPTLVLGLLLMALMAALAHWQPRLPGALVCSAVAVLASYFLNLGQYGLALVGTVPSGLPRFEMPLLLWSDIALLAPAAVAIAFLAFSDGILLAQAFAEKSGDDINPNQELAALGTANILAALWQGFPVSASQSRTSVVVAAGGRTQVAQLVAAAGLLLFLVFFTGLIALLPKVALGAILIVTAVGMLELASLRTLYKVDRNEFSIALTVTLVMLIAGVIAGIIAGLLISLIAVLVEISRPRDAVLRRLISDGKFHDCLEIDEAEEVPGVLVYRLYAPLIFANARYVVERIQQLVDAADPTLEWLIIDAQAITDMDVTAAQRFAELHRELRAQGVEIKIADAPRPFREELAKVGLSDALGSQQFFVSVKKAVESFEHLRSLQPTPSSP